MHRATAIRTICCDKWQEQRHKKCVVNYNTIKVIKYTLKVCMRSGEAGAPSNVTDSKEVN